MHFHCHASGYAHGGREPLDEQFVNEILETRMARYQRLLARNVELESLLEAYAIFIEELRRQLSRNRSSNIRRICDLGDR